MATTNDGKKGGYLKGKAHSECDENGCGIKAIVTDAGNRPVELEGDEVILTKKAMKDQGKYTITGTPKEIASYINHEIGDGVEFADDPDHAKKIMAEGGVISDPKFKEWFGESKVVSQKPSRPLVVYHGSPDLRKLKEEEVFKTPTESFAGSDENRAYFFTDSYAKAKSYADPYRAFDIQNAEEGVMKFYLSLQNPLVVDAGGAVWRKYETVIDGTPLVGTRNIVRYAQKNGYDGLIVKNVKDSYETSKRSPVGNVYVAFNPTQIKSADGSNTTFDPKNPKYTMADGGNVTEPQGDCYVAAGQLITDYGWRGIEFNGTPYLVHAQVVGQGKIRGLKYGHAWVEDDENVYDYSNGREIVMPKLVYYVMGGVTDEEPYLYRYTSDEARRKMLDTGHYGSWDLVTESGL